MQFCPKCGAILVKKTKNLGCPRCGYSSKEKSDLKSSEKINERKEVAVISDEQGESNPIIDEKCKKCKNNKAYFWTVQIRAGDEDETKFFKCTKCGHTWRENR